MPRTIRLLLRIVFVITLLLPATLIKAQTYLNAQLPWHDRVLDSRGKLLAWYQPDKNLGYDKVLHLGGDFFEHKVPDDQRTQRLLHVVD